MKTTKRELRQIIRQLVNEQMQQPQQQTKAKETEVKIIGTTLKIITMAAPQYKAAVSATYWIIGKDKMYEIDTKFSNDVLKLLTSLNAAILQPAQKVTIGAMREINFSLENFVRNYGPTRKNKREFGMYIAGLVKSAGVKAYATFLAGAAAVPEIANNLGNWLGQEWASIEKSVGIGWEQAKKYGTNVLNSVKSGAKAAYDYGSNKVGKASEFVQGLFEVFERFNSFESNTTSGILKEARYISSSIL
jgi:hypothetical protein